MCCILACFSQRPTLQTLQNIGAFNRDGWGVMWIDRRTGKTMWRKGLASASDVFDWTETLPFPFAVHARYATAGGNDAALTHPFPIPEKGGKPSLALSGAADAVMMHNGHFSGWEKAAASIGLQLPKNARGWSDTRALAAVIGARGLSVLKAPELEHQKFATLSAKRGLEIWGRFHTPTGYDVGGLFASAYTGSPMPSAPSPDPRETAYREWKSSIERDARAVSTLSQAARMRNEFDERFGGCLDGPETSADDILDRIDRVRARVAAVKVTRKGGQ